MGDLSKNFSLREFNCKDGTPYPEEWIKSRLMPLVNDLEVIREVFGNRAIKITSGYRTPRHNRKVGGAKNSQHLFGIAVDFKVDGVDAKEVADKLVDLINRKIIGQGGVGKYDMRTHYDHRGTAARWGF